LGLDEGWRENVTMSDYPAGHMMYVQEESLRRMRAEIGRFVG
jgi:carboxypeptidase C (cathepsin A)